MATEQINEKRKPELIYSALILPVKENFPKGRFQSMFSTTSYLSLFLVFLLSQVACQLTAADTPLWTEYLANKANGKGQILPDYSYAGYQHGDLPIPGAIGRIFKVRDYGGLPDDDKADGPSIQKAVDAAAAAGGGVVLFEKGVYLINTEETLESVIKIKNSGIVFRGQGGGDDGTVLYSPAQMLPDDPKQMWTGHAPIAVLGFAYGSRKSKLTKVSPMNSFGISLEKGHSFVAGDRIRLSATRKSAAAAPYIAPHEWPAEWTAGVSFREFHEVKRVEGNVITLAEPLLTATDELGDWMIQEVTFISNVGFENIHFRGNWNENFKHHRSWRDDSAWRGLLISGLENGWIRNCVFENYNWAVQLVSSRQVTLENVLLTGTKGHFGVQSTGSTGLLGIRIIDEAKHHHGPSLQSGACGTVYFECKWRDDGSLDSHANNPYATLHDNNSGGATLNGCGGDKNNFPHHLHALVIWNLDITGSNPSPTDYWSWGKGGYGSSFNQVFLVGEHGMDQQVLPETVFRRESVGTPVTPRSLWLAQLKDRLGKIPEHFQTYDQ